MDYPELNFSENSKRLGGNLYKIFEKDLARAAEIFEEDGYMITGMERYIEKTQGWDHVHYYVMIAKAS